MYCRRFLPRTGLKTSRNYSTILPHEVAKFSKLSHEWWDPHGNLETLHQINPMRIQYIRNHLCNHFNLDPSNPQPFSELSFADVGCGGGLLSESLARLGGSVVGIDASESNIQVATLHSSKDPILSKNPPLYKHITVEEISSESPESFDVVCALEIIEHVDQVPQFISAISTLVKPGGALFMSTINRTLKSYFLTIVMAEHVLRWVPRGTHDWNKYLSPEELQVELVKNGIQCQDVKGFVLQPFSPEKWGLSNDKDANYLLFATKKLS